jgi:hypothetical protein
MTTQSGLPESAHRHGDRLLGGAGSAEAFAGGSGAARGGDHASD